MPTSWDGKERRQDGYGIIERIHGLEVKVTALTTEIRDHREIDAKMLAELHTMAQINSQAIFGGPENVGLKEHVRTLREIEKTRSIHIRAIGVTAGTAFLNMVYQYIRKMFTHGG